MLSARFEFQINGTLASVDHLHQTLWTPWAASTGPNRPGSPHVAFVTAGFETSSQHVPVNYGPEVLDDRPNTSKRVCPFSRRVKSRAVMSGSESDEIGVSRRC